MHAPYRMAVVNIVGTTVLLLRLLLLLLFLLILVRGQRNKETEDQGRYACPGGRSGGAQSLGPQPPPSGHGWEQRAGSSASWSGDARCLPGCLRLPGSLGVAGGIPPCQAPSPASLCLSSRSRPSPLPVCCTVAACPGHTEPQCPGIPLTPGRVPPSSSHHPGGALTQGESPGPTEGKAGVATAGPPWDIMQVLGWRGSDHVRRHHCELSRAAIHFRGPRALGRSPPEVVRLGAFKSMYHATQKAIRCGIPFKEMSRMGKCMETHR